MSLPQSAHKVIAQTNIKTLYAKPKEEEKYLDVKSRYKKLCDEKRDDEAKEVLKELTDEKARDYLAAKYGGDFLAGRKVVERLIKNEKVKSLSKVIGLEKPTEFVYMTSQESSHINILPYAYASVLVERLKALGHNNLLYPKEIQKVGGGHNTGKSQHERLNNESYFWGETEQGTQIVIVDDVWTSGNTIMSLIDYLSKTHDVTKDIVSISALATSRYGGQVAPSEELLTNLYKKSTLSPEEINELLGYNLSRFATGSELQGYVGHSGKIGREGLVGHFGRRQEDLLSQEVGRMENKGWMGRTSRMGENPIYVAEDRDRSDSTRSDRDQSITSGGMGENHTRLDGSSSYSISSFGASLNSLYGAKNTPSKNSMLIGIAVEDKLKDKTYAP